MSRRNNILFALGLALLIGAAAAWVMAPAPVRGYVTHKQVSITDGNTSYLLVLDIGGGRRVECHAVARLFAAAKEGSLMSCPAGMVRKEQ